MAAIKDIAQSAQKWSRRSSVAGADYQTGVSNPRRPWAQAAAEAGANYRQGVTAAAQAGRFEAGVRKAGDERWRNNAASKGPGRYAEGVTLAVGDWQAGFGPYQQALAALQLPARGPAGSPANLQRVTAVAQGLRQLKERTGGAAR